MSDISLALNFEQVKAALAAEGQAMSDEQVQALAGLIRSMGGVDLARVAVELLADLEEAA